MTLWLEPKGNHPGKTGIDPPVRKSFFLPYLLLFVVFLSAMAYAGGSVYWFIKKDNELEKSRRIELELRNNIKERDYIIQQYRQQIKQLERRVEILDAIQELSADNMSKEKKAQIAKMIDETSSKYGHDPFLILALISSESSIQPGVTSESGANGLMQLMPSTGQHLSRQIQQSPQIIGLSKGKPFAIPHYRDLEGNIELGTLYLTQLMLKYQNLEYALYAYNLGPNLFEKRLKDGGPYPRNFLNKVLKQYAKLTAHRRSSEEETIPSFYTHVDLNRLVAQANISRQD